MNQHRKAQLVLLVVLTLLLAATGPAHAMRYLITPAITLQETYDDNIFFVDDDDFEHYIGPTITLDAQSEKGNLALSAGWHIYEYSSYNEFDRVNQSYGLNSSYSITEKATVRLGAGYTLDKRFDIDLEELALLVEPERRRRFQVSPGVSYQINPNNDVSLGYRFEALEYDGFTSDSTYHELTGGWGRRMTERTTFWLNVLGSMYTYDNPAGDFSYMEGSVNAGIVYQLTEKDSANLYAGAGRIRYEDDVTGDSDYETRFIASAEMIRRLERWTLSGSYQRDLAPEPDGDSVLRDRLRFRASYAITERLSGRLTAYYVHTKVIDFFGDDEERDLYRITPTLDYRLWENALVGLGYTFSRLDRENQDTEDRNRVYLSFSYGLPIEY
jgi:hypothetical protein